MKQLADQVGMTRVLGPSEEGRLALFLILARIAHAGSRLSAVRWAEQHAVSDILGLENFNEYDLYDALDWLAREQQRIEQDLYQRYVKDQGAPPAIILYDVTSSYFEGEQNELADYGYNRDGKKGKKQTFQIDSVHVETTWKDGTSLGDFQEPVEMLETAYANDLNWDPSELNEMTAAAFFLVLSMSKALAK